jgi:hypothetical protein
MGPTHWRIKRVVASSTRVGEEKVDGHQLEGDFVYTVARLSRKHQDV